MFYVLVRSKALTRKNESYLGSSFRRSLMNDIWCGLPFKCLWVTYVKVNKTYDKIVTDKHLLIAVPCPLIISVVRRLNRRQIHWRHVRNFRLPLIRISPGEHCGRHVSARSHCRCFQRCFSLYLILIKLFFTTFLGEISPLTHRLDEQGLRLLKMPLQKLKKLQYTHPFTGELHFHDRSLSWPGSDLATSYRVVNPTQTGNPLQAVVLSEDYQSSQSSGHIFCSLNNYLGYNS